MSRLLVVALLLACGVACGSNGERTLRADFTDVGDLVNRANVQQFDTVVGRVSSIELRGWTARVTMRLKPGVELPEGTRAVVRSTSLLGEKFVDLQPPATPSTAEPISDGGLIPAERTAKTPEVEEVFNQLGAILASGAVADLGMVTSATARIVEGQSDDIGRVLDGTAKLVASLSAQREAIASALTSLGNASSTFATGSDTLERFVVTSAKVGTILAAQRQQLEDLVIQLDRLGQSSGRLMREHKQDIDSAVKSLITVLPKVQAARAGLDAALTKLPSFATFFAASMPGDYVVLDVAVEGLPPLGVSAASPPTRGGRLLASMLWGAAR